MNTRSNAVNTRRFFAFLGLSLMMTPFACVASTEEGAIDDEIVDSIPGYDLQSVNGGVTCGDGYCTPSDGETCLNCPNDCGPCPECGDNWCNGSETCFSCKNDCCPSCGDGLCTGYENAATCLADCGKYYLDLISIQVVHKDDALGNDEPRLFVEGIKVWSNESFSGTASLATVPEKVFADNIAVQLNEWDGFPENKNKTLGSFTVSKATAQIDTEIEQVITNNGCNILGYCYKIRYKVLHK